MYALHPGWVTSASDEDRHWIGVGALARLYGLRRSEYVVWVDGEGLRWDDYVHLSPRRDGRYTLTSVDGKGRV